MDKRNFCLSLFFTILFISLIWFPKDDGLRHVGLAFSDVQRSWGDVYPFSQFEKVKDYDPWYGYDLSLRLIAIGFKALSAGLSIIFPQLSFSFLSLISKVLLVKMVAFIFISILFYLVLKKNNILDEIIDSQTFLVAFALLIVFLYFSTFRFTTIRPFVFGTFFLLYSVDQKEEIWWKGFLKGFVSAALLSFFYPYLSWVYIIPAMIAHILKGDKGFAVGLSVFLLPFIILQPSSFWQLQTALFASNMVRDRISLPIKELSNVFQFKSFYGYLLIFFICYPKFSSASRKLSYCNLLLLIYLLPAIIYVRYFFDIILPLFFVSFGKDMLSLAIVFKQMIFKTISETILGWKAIIRDNLNKMFFGDFLIKWWIRIKSKKRQSGQLQKIQSKKGIVIQSCLCMTLLIGIINYSQIYNLKKLYYGLSYIPLGTSVLTDFNSQYLILYLRPDLRVIPSCELGFSDRKILKEYINYFNNNKIVDLVRKTKTEYFISNKQPGYEENNFFILFYKDDGLNFKVWRYLTFREGV